MTIIDLYDFAEQNGIIIDDTFVLENTAAVSVPLQNDLCVIGLHRALRGSRYKAQLAHEIGHCATGAFYNAKTPAFSRGQCERRADKWAVNHLLPKRKLIRALKSGLVEVWQLAEHFNLPDEFVATAVEIYGIKRAI